MLFRSLAKNAASAIEQRKSSAMDSGDMMANAVKDMIETSNKAFENMQAMTSQMASIAGASIKAAGGGAKPSSKK